MARAAQSLAASPVIEDTLEWSRYIEAERHLREAEHAIVGAGATLETWEAAVAVVAVATASMDRAKQ